jgi:hypothetical protein
MEKKNFIFSKRATFLLRVFAYLDKKGVEFLTQKQVEIILIF